MRKTFKNGYSHGGAVVFIDEIDALPNSATVICYWFGRLYLLGADSAGMKALFLGHLAYALRAWEFTDAR